MTDTTGNARVKTERHADLPPPKSEVGIYGWMYHNLFSTWYNVILSLFGSIVAALVAWQILDFAVFGAVWVGESQADCKTEDGALIHACWVFVSDRFSQFMYGFYPGEERWSINFSYLLLIMACVPLFLRKEWMERGAGYAVAAVTVAIAVFWGVGPALVAALMMFGPFALARSPLFDMLPRGGDKILFESGVRLAIVVIAAILGYLIGYQAFGAEEAETFAWAGAFIAFGLITLDRVGVKVWYAYLLIFIYPLIAFHLWVGGTFGTEPVETAKWGGLFLTLVIAGTGIAASLPIGILFALGRRSEMPAVRAVSIAFIELWRGVPLITVLYMASNMLPLFVSEGVNLDKLLRALIGVALFSAAYMAEVVRGGLQAIPKGQYEAAASMGLGYWQMMRLIILPQALKLVIPGIVNSFIALFKDTTLVLIIGLFDLLNTIQQASNHIDWLGMNVEGYLFAALLYWIFCFSMSRYSMHLERKLHTGHRR